MSAADRHSVRRPPAETRNLMLETISHLLESRAPWDIRASEVAAAAGTTQPNFYSHFRNMEDAIMARSEQVWALYPTGELRVLLEEGLAAPDDQSIQAFFVVTIEFWRAHAGLLSAVSRLAGGEHPALRGMRHQAQDPVIRVCEAAVRRAQANADLPSELQPQLAANAALRFLDEAASHYQTMRDAGEFSRDAIIVTIAAMFRRLLTGR